MNCLDGVFLMLFVSDHACLYILAYVGRYLDDGNEQPGGDRDSLDIFFLLIKILSSVWAPGYAAQCVSSTACRSTVLPIAAWVNAGTTSWLPFLSTRALCGAYLKVCLLLTDYSQVIVFCSSVLHLIFLFFREMIVQDGLPWKSNKVLGVGRSFSLCQSCLHRVSNQVRLFFSSGSGLQLCRKICRYLTNTVLCE